MQTFKKIGVVLLILAAIASVSLSMVVGSGVAVGYVLRRVIPSIDFGIATLCGLCAVGICTFVMVAIFSVYAVTIQNFDTTDEDELEDSDLLSDEQVDRVAEQLSEAVVMRMVVDASRPPPRSRNRR